MIFVISVYSLYYYFVLRKFIENLLSNYYYLKFPYPQKFPEPTPFSGKAQKDSLFAKYNTIISGLVIFYLLCNMFLISFNFCFLTINTWVHEKVS